MLSTPAKNPEPQKEEEPFGLGCALDFFSEHEEVFQMIENLKNIVNSTISIQECAHEKFSFILNQYIEQPHLIDSHVNELLEKIINIVRDDENSIEHKHLAFKYLFVITNVRGYKFIVRQLPHEVSDFEPVLQLLESQVPDDPDTWTTRYLLLLWLSIIVMIPFHMSRFDGFDKIGSNKPTVMERILHLIKTYAVVPDKCRDAAAYLCRQFITRSDVKEKHLSSFIEWAKECSRYNEDNVFVAYGALACIASILKHGKREDLLPYARNLLQWVVSAEFKNFPGANIQKLVYKIIQRIGFTFLPPRIASWRYKRGNRSLAANLSSGDNTGSSSNKCEEAEPEDPIEVPDEVEEVIDQLILALRSVDGVVRWTAAKGIGRVTGRLPKDLADEVVGSILELFSPRETDGAWHGGCLALAELSRRGLLLPERLSQVVPVVLKALVYDEPRGYASVGSHIRDSACYVCWSFSRAYESNVLAPHVKEIASALLIVTCFDKEINCRRAASAAFQENVGRQGSFPHGIDILTVADFFSVSVRSTAFLNISVYIAQFEEYSEAMIDHLVTRKVDYWDSNIRELTAKALHNLTAKNSNYMVSSVLPSLLEKTYSIDLNARHGSILAIGEIVLALSYIAKQNDKTIGDVLKEDLLEKIKILILKFREKFYFKGMGGELMKHACCDFIQKCSLAQLPYHDDSVVTDWLLLLNECISYEVASVRLAAVLALPALLQEYYVNKIESFDNIIKQYVKNLLNSTNEQSRMGHCLALGALPKAILVNNLDFVITSLIQSIEITQISLKWAESRKDAVKALTSVVVTMTDNIGKEFTEDHIKSIYSSFIEGLKDYTVDKRGDIGAWIREASVLGLQTITFLLAERYPQVLTSELMTEVLSRIAQQCVEKIDRTRAHAAQIFYSFVHAEPRIPNLPHHEDLIRIFPKEECDVLNWNSSSVTFPRFVQLIFLPSFIYNVMVGIICSIGGMTETLVKDSSSSFFALLKTASNKSLLESLCDIILKIFVNYQKVDRITVPMFRFLDKLFDSGSLETVISEENSEFMKKLLKLIQLEISGCKDIYKLIDGINVLCQFIQMKSELSDIALVQLSILLCHRQSYVRRTTSSKVYEALLVNGEDGRMNPETLEKVMTILSSTDWEKPIEEIKPIRNELCQLMGIRVPVPVKKKT